MRGQSLQSISGMQKIGKSFTNPISKYRNAEPEYWTNKFNRRKRMSKIQKRSRQINSKG